LRRRSEEEGLERESKRKKKVGARKEDTTDSSERTFTHEILEIVD